MAKLGECYATIRPMLQTFDLLLFKGSDFVSNTIVKVEHMDVGTKMPEFTHVGCVILGKDLLPITRPAEEAWLKEDGVYLFESTMSGKIAGGPKDVTEHARFGVQLRDLDKVVDLYDVPEASRMAWAPLRKEIRERFDAKKAREEYEKYKGLLYDASIIDLAAVADVPGARYIRDSAAFQWLRERFCCCCCSDKRTDFSPNTQKTDNQPAHWMFCSELIANVYKDIGIIPQSVVADNVLPVDFICDPDNPEKTLDADHQVPPVCLQFVRFHRILNTPTVSQADTPVAVDTNAALPVATEEVHVVAL